MECVKWRSAGCDHDGVASSVGYELATQPAHRIPVANFEVQETFAVDGKQRANASCGRFGHAIARRTSFPDAHGTSSPFQVRNTAADCNFSMTHDDTSSLSVGFAQPRAPTESVGVCRQRRSLIRNDGRQDRARTPANNTGLGRACGNRGNNAIVAAEELAELMMTRSLVGPAPRKASEHGGTNRDAVGAAVGGNRREHLSILANALPQLGISSSASPGVQVPRAPPS